MNREREIDFDCYIIYEDGRIYSKYYKRFLKGSIWTNGYVLAKFKLKDGTRHPILWHKVIWQFFNGDIPEGMQINHIDENKSNNALSNLNLLTPKENSNWGTRNERLSKSLSEVKKGIIPKATPPKQVYQYTIDGKLVRIWSSTMECDRSGYGHQAVGKCCLNKFNRLGNNIYKGYMWKYDN